MENYTWVEDDKVFGAGQTVIQPEATIEISANGSQSVYVPGQIRFRDAGMIRPVCPFLEVWCYAESDSSEKQRLFPLTLDFLREQEAALANLTYEVIATNRKAARRTGDEDCSFSAYLAASAADYARRPLPAFSPNAGGKPLVFEHSPIPLGTFQPARPVLKQKDGSHIRHGIDLRVIRARYTPPRGQVYGPPSATVAADPWTGRRYELVPHENRITNPEAAWNFHDKKKSDAYDAAPQPTYDGESDTARRGRSFGVVDDTCEVLIRARLAFGGRCFESTARIFTGPPDYAPDRRPFYSLADEFSDRDRASYPANGSPAEEQNYVFDLFRRVYETAMLINVDRYRLRMTVPGSKQVLPDLPRTDEYSMRKRAKGDPGPDDSAYMSQEAQDRLQDPVNEDTHPTGNTHLVRAALARDTHEVMADSQAVIDKILLQPDLIPKVIRPPFKAFHDLTPDPTPPAGPGVWRDGRVDRDQSHDMRMPPYMRDSDACALSLTPRQYDLLLQFISDVREGKLGTAAQLHRDQLLKRRRAAKP
jgi:hypothetical protein